jgi:hypothetical protein
MDAAVYVFSRDIKSDGMTRRQVLTVFATDDASAQRLVTSELLEMRSAITRAATSGDAPRRSEPSLAAQPTWRVERIPLDAPRILTFTVV